MTRSEGQPTRCPRAPEVVVLQATGSRQPSGSGSHLGTPSTMGAHQHAGHGFSGQGSFVCSDMHNIRRAATASMSTQMWGHGREQTTPDLKLHEADVQASIEPDVQGFHHSNMHSWHVSQPQKAKDS